MPITEALFEGGGFLLPAPFTLSPFAPCSLAFFHSCSLLIFSLLPFHFSLLPAPLYFLPMFPDFSGRDPYKDDRKTYHFAMLRHRFVEIGLFRHLDLVLVCYLLPFTDKNCAPCSLITILLLPAPLTIWFIASCSLVSKRTFSLLPDYP